EQALPDEACGFLLGDPGRIDRVVPARNVHATPHTHFEIDPQALLNALRAERHGGPRVVGYYHSHPQGTPEPSAIDREHARGDGRTWSIVGAGDVRFWRDDEAGFVELPTRLATG